MEKIAAILAAASMGAAIWWESTYMALISLIWSVVGVIAWKRRTAPHDHWAEEDR